MLQSDSKTKTLLLTSNLSCIYKSIKNYFSKNSMKMITVNDKILLTCCIVAVLGIPEMEMVFETFSWTPALL